MFTAPAVRPVTTPAALTVARPVLLLLHVPFIDVLDKVTVVPVHIFAAPVVVAGVVLMPIARVTEQPDFV